MIHLTINGIPCEAAPRAKVLQIAAEHGIYIPSLCSHPALEAWGGCRLCVVEVTRSGDPSPTVTTSCTLEVEEGMVVETDTEALKQQRKLALELMLSHHPEECSDCPKYGHCELQSMIQYLGVSNQRTIHNPMPYPLNDKNPIIRHDMKRCIKCGRCVRMCWEVRGVKAIDFQRDGKDMIRVAPTDGLLMDSNCKFCTACVAVCPTGSIMEKLEQEASAPVPCQNACPAHTDVPAYLRAIRKGDMDTAIGIIHERLTFAGSLGHICSRLCEGECKRQYLNQPIAIHELKRQAALQDKGLWKARRKQLPDTGKRVAVVGAGPAGLTAAYYLRKQGHAVTVLEKMDEPGGQLRYGIPEERLPLDVLRRDVDDILEVGVELRCGQEATDPRQLRQEYDAVLLAVGNQKGVRLNIPGSELPEVYLNLDYLRSQRSGQPLTPKGRVAVLGGGNVAYDVALTLAKRGAEEVHVLCLEDRDHMTADEDEILEGESLGIHLHPAVTFCAIEGDAHVTGLTVESVSSFHFDEQRRAVIETVPGSRQTIPVDSIVMAVGQRPDVPSDFFLPVEGVFQAGDCAYGTRFVVTAVHAGREAAEAIDRYLGGDGDLSESLVEHYPLEPWIGRTEGFGQQTRCEEDCQAEAGRCLQCDLRTTIEKPVFWVDLVKEG